MILCCGEALIDLVPAGDGACVRPVPGGSIFNVAVGLARLGAPAGYFGKLSTDFFGNFLLQTLSANGVDTSLALRAPGPTSLAFVDLPASGGSEPRYVFYTDCAVDRSLRIDELPERLAASVHALHFGSISLVLEPCASSLEALLQRESHRRVISLDPNVRPPLIQDPQAYRARFERWTGFADIIRLSRADFDWLYPDRPTGEVFTGWFDRGVSLVILTEGAKGAYGMTAQGARADCPAPAVDVVDTVGAGDSFLAALLFYLDREGRLRSQYDLRQVSAESLLQILQFANRAAALTCSRPGADPPFLGELEADPRTR